jgi:dipeptidyl aminopeptidase/acylaminoacyl peptidase
MNHDEYLDLLLTLPDMYDFRPKVSPDGRWVAWVWYRADIAADVYAAPTDGSLAPLRLTATDENTDLVSWTLDSKAVVVEQDKDGNERVQLFRVDIDKPKTMLPLTQADPDYYIQGGRVHPNGKWLVYAANYDDQAKKEIEASWVYRQDIGSGQRQVLARTRKAGTCEPELNETGSHILYPRQDLHPAGIQMWLVDIEGKKDREILNAGPDVKTGARWLPDGKNALVLVETKTHRKLGVWSLESDQIRWLLDDPARDIEDAFVPHGSQMVVVMQNEKGQTRCSLLPLDGGEEVVLPEIPGSLIPLAPVGGGEWVGYYYSSRQPTDVVRFPLEKIDPQKFCSLTGIWQRTKLTEGDFIPAEGFSWTSVDGLQIHGWLYRAPGQAKGTIVWVHGGPTWHSQDWINCEVQYLAHQGFNVLDPNYRGSTGYGLPFREAIREDGWGGREQDDIRCGIQALIDAGIAQPGKIGITGTSYGGYSSWVGITRFPPELVAASAPICGMTDLVVDYETTRPDLRPYSAEMMGGTPQEVPQRFYERSPIHFVDQIKGKLLIVQGAQDPNVTPKNVTDVEKNLKKAGVEYNVLMFEDEGHGIAKPHNQRTLFQVLSNFFEQAFAG